MNDILEQIKLFFSNIERKKIILILSLLFLALTLFLLTFKRLGLEKKTNLTEQIALTELSTSTQQSSSSDKSVATLETIMVDIKGAVLKEGVYQLKKDSRVTDAIQLAGGLREDADQNAINLAQKLSDESILYVARKGENKSVIDSSNQAVISSNQSEQKDQKINLNKANLEDLRKIPGIGEKRAKEILEVRDAQGGFKNFDDLLKISGIGQKTLEKIKDDISID